MIEGVDPKLLGAEAGGSAILGGVLGFTAKKAVKVVAILMGIQVAFLKFLEARNILSIDWSEFSNQAMGVADLAAQSAPPSFLMSALPTASIGGGFSAGFLLGYKRG